VNRWFWQSKARRKIIQRQWLTGLDQLLNNSERFFYGTGRLTARHILASPEKSPSSL